MLLCAIKLIRCTCRVKCIHMSNLAAVILSSTVRSTLHTVPMPLHSSINYDKGQNYDSLTVHRSKIEYVYRLPYLCHEYSPYAESPVCLAHTQMAHLSYTPPIFTTAFVTVAIVVGGGAVTHSE